MTEQEPVLSTGPSETVERVARTGVQTLSPAIILEGLRVFHIWAPEAAQATWLISFSTIATALGLNVWERVKNRKLLGRPIT